MGNPHGPCRPLTRVNRVCVADAQVLDPGVKPRPPGPAPTHQHVWEHKGSQQPAVHHRVPDQHVQPFSLCEAGHVQHHGTWGRWAVRSGHGQSQVSPSTGIPLVQDPHPRGSSQTSQRQAVVGGCEGATRTQDGAAEHTLTPRPLSPGTYGGEPTRMEDW